MALGTSKAYCPVRRRIFGCSRISNCGRSYRDDCRDDARFYCGPRLNFRTLTHNNARTRKFKKKLLDTVEKVRGLQATIERSAERVEEALAKLGDLERLAVSEQAADAASATAEATAQQEEENWERLRELWNSNGRRLDATIQRIGDKRTRRRFLQMSKRNYAGIIEALAEAKLISESAKTASLQLHSTFMRHRSRRAPVTDEVIGALVTLDHMLEYELAPRASQEASDPVATTLTVERRAVEPV
jgi:hypothetical protein